MFGNPRAKLPPYWSDLLLGVLLCSVQWTCKDMTMLGIFACFLHLWQSFYCFSYTSYIFQRKMACLKAFFLHNYYKNYYYTDWNPALMLHSRRPGQSVFKSPLPMKSLHKCVFQGYAFKILSFTHRYTSFFEHFRSRRTKRAAVEHELKVKAVKPWPNRESNLVVMYGQSLFNTWKHQPCKIDHGGEINLVGFLWYLVLQISE